MKKVMLFGALIALFASSNLYAATCTDSGSDGYTDDCDAVMQLDIPLLAVIQFPATAGSDLTVSWDGTAATLTDSINICIGTNGGGTIDITAASTNGFNVTDGSTHVPYSLDLNSGLDLNTGAVVLLNADADDLACTASDIPLELAFTQAALQAATTTGAAFTDTVTITVSPQ
jgi:hypothetical protein